MHSSVVIFEFRIAPVKLTIHKFSEVPFLIFLNTYCSGWLLVQTGLVLVAKHIFSDFSIYLESLPHQDDKNNYEGHIARTNMSIPRAPFAIIFACNHKEVTRRN